MPSWKYRIRRLLPDISANTASRGNYRMLREALSAAGGGRKVLVIGGATLGSGMKQLLSDPAIQLVESDVRRGPRTAVVCDAQWLPFADGCFDAVVIQAVLHLLPDPELAAGEIARVLAAGGMLYSEAPFLQPAHGGRHDFSRFTLLGHRRLFRRFAEISSGACNGPGTALAFSLRYFAMSFVKSRWAADLVKGVTLCTLFWLKYTDYLVAGAPGSIDGAAGTYFLGRKSSYSVPDREIVSRYKGAVHLEAE